MKTRYLIYSAILIGLLASCATKRQLPVSSVPEHTTAEVKRAMVKVATATQQTTVGCNLQTVFDSVCIVSVQPVTGMEMFAMHVTKDQILVIDRLHRRYAITHFETINSFLQPAISFEELEQIVSGTILPEGIMSYTRHFSAKKRAADLTITYPSIIYDQPITLRPQKIQSYQQVDIQTLLKSLLK